MVHVDGTVVEADDALARLFGFDDPADVVGRSILDFVAPHSRVALLLECIGADDRTIVVEATTDLAEFHGQSARAVTVRDATVGRSTDLELREATERFRLAFDGAPIGMALVAPDGRWLQVNAALCDIVGYSSEELLPMTFQDITHPDDLDADLEFAQQVLAGVIPGYSMEKRYFHADGHVVWINLSVSLVRDAAGAPLYFISQIEDITDRSQASAELALAEERFRALVEFAPEAMVIVDHAGAIRIVNRQTEEIFGHERDDLIGKPIEMLLPEGLGDAVRGRRSDGTEFPIEMSLSQLETSAGSLVSAAIRDVTERKEMERAYCVSPRTCGCWNASRCRERGVECRRRVPQHAGGRLRARRASGRPCVRRRRRRHQGSRFFGYLARR